MKHPGLLLALALVSLPAAAQTVVVPTGDPAQDVAAVRAAVQGGGTVLLKAHGAAGEPQAFDFGDFPVGAVHWNDFGSGYVALGTSGNEILVVPAGSTLLLFSLGNDVRLLGETVGDVKTTIRGGTIPIRNFGPLGIPGSNAIVFGLGRFSVENIRFTEPALQAVYLSHLAALPQVRAVLDQLDVDFTIEIRDCEFLDVQPAYAGRWLGQGAFVDGAGGEVRIEGNVAQFTPGRFAPEQRAYELANNLGPRPELWEGLTITDLQAPGTMRGNRVAGVDVGLHVWFEGSTQMRIADNWVELKPEGFYGIAAEANHTYVIEGNTVIAPGAFPDGISLWATDQVAGINHSTIRQNRIVMDGSNFGGITLYTGGTGNLFAQNVVEGGAAYALGLASPFLPAPFLSTHNTFRGNQIARFTPNDSVWWGTGADFLFDVNAQYNELFGRSGIVKDLGVGNTATGWNRGHGPSRAQRAELAARVAAKRERLRPLRPDSLARLERRSSGAVLEEAVPVEVGESEADPAPTASRTPRKVQDAEGPLRQRAR